MRDPHSFANFADISIRHADIDLSVDFDRKILKGHIQLRCQVLSDGVKELKLDAKDLEIGQIENDGTKVKSSVANPDRRPDDAFGEGLVVYLANTSLKAGAETSIKIEYSTTPKCSAAQWMTPEQTNGKNHPYFYTQCQAIHARSLFPIQDTPSVKLTYKAAIHVPAPLVAIMSAILVSSSPSHTFTFDQPVPMPAYLIAIAAGNLAKADLGKRCAVWCEPEQLKECASEFDETEDMLKTAEELMGPYEWGRYDLLVLPSSFPYGGMENPCLTFVTPTIVAGDKSLVDVVAHEISHSWTGNLVTNATWMDFWLNEGFTMFVERKILGRLYGEPTRQLDSRLGWEELKETIKTLGPESPFTELYTPMEGVDPDEGYSLVPYEKGYNFLYFLESVVGGPSIFEDYLREHVLRFRRKSVTTEEWKAFFLEWCEGKGIRAKVENEVDWNVWLHGRGMPPSVNNYDATLADQCAALVNKWLEVGRGASPPAKSEYDSLSTLQKRVFWSKLVDHAPLNVKVIEAMREMYSMSNVRNCDIRCNFQLTCLKSGMDSMRSEIVKFIKEQGRMKYSRPLMRELYKTNKEFALKLLEDIKPTYHIICTRMIVADFKKIDDKNRA